MKDKKFIKIVIIAAFIGITGVLYGTGQSFRQPDNGDTETSAPIPELRELTSSEEPAEAVQKKELAVEVLCVHVCGAVKVPGVYELNEGARVKDALEAAGGLLPGAAGDSVNQAAPVEDGKRIYIPNREEIENGKFSAEQMDDTQGTEGIAARKVDLNHATEQELMTIPGIGLAKAKSIIQYREENGSFSKTEDIMKIEGIKQGIYNKMKEFITVQSGGQG